MKRTRLKNRSPQRAKRERDSAPIRKQLIAEADNRCFWCGHGPSYPHPGKPAGLSSVHCHEILCGGLRQKTLGEPCSLLVLCWEHNAGDFHRRQLWPHARQLALLQMRSPDRYDLTRFNWLRNPDAPLYVTQLEVDAYYEELVVEDPQWHQ